MTNLHDLVADELFYKRSVAALIWLINRGRELELSYHHHQLFISKHGSKSSVSLWDGEEEQHFRSMESLWERGMVGEEKLRDIWNGVILECLF